VTEDLGDIFVVVAEFGDQGPIVMETEGQGTSRQAAFDRAARMRSHSNIIRTAIARLTFESGNELLIHDLKRMQI
jgi:hypothetical protein